MDPLRIPVTERIPFVQGYVYTAADVDSFFFITEAEARIRSKAFYGRPGQITRNSSLGDFLYKLASAGCREWLEIGSWNGLGSTLCILDGFAQRLEETPHLYSFELDPLMYNVARENLQDHPAFSCVEFIHNKLISDIDLAFPDINTSDQFSEHFYLHYEREKGLYTLAEGFKPPRSPQVAMLDGGEYSGILDWKHLDKSQLQWLILDDVDTVKNKTVVEELMKDTRWILVEKSSERNGWAAFKTTQQ
jgi:hypothetical protein